MRCKGNGPSPLKRRRYEAVLEPALRGGAIEHLSRSGLRNGFSCTMLPIMATLAPRMSASSAQRNWKIYDWRGRLFGLGRVDWSVLFGNYAAC